MIKIEQLKINMIKTFHGKLRGKLQGCVWHIRIVSIQKMNK